MPTLADIEVTSLEEFEFEIPCDENSKDFSDPPCPNAARWTMWIKHGHQGSKEDHSITLHLCDMHKEIAIRWWTDNVCNASPNKRVSCRVCKEVVNNQKLEDLIRFNAI